MRRAAIAVLVAMTILMGCAARRSSPQSKSMPLGGADTMISFAALPAMLVVVGALVYASRGVLPVGPGTGDSPTTEEIDDASAATPTTEARDDAPAR